MLQEAHIRMLKSIYQQSQLALDLLENVLNAEQQKKKREELVKLFNDYMEIRLAAEASLAEVHVEPPTQRLLPKWWTLSQLDPLVMTPEQYEDLSKEIIEGAYHDIQEIRHLLIQINDNSEDLSWFGLGNFALGQMDVTRWPPHL